MTPNNLVHENERLDELHRNGYYIIQDPARFCFGMDAVLLSGFARARRGERVLDLGTGTGIIPILMEAKTEAEDFTALEIQEESADMARRSVLYNHLEEKEAQEFLRKADKSRASYYNYYTDKIWGAAESYDLCINSSLYGIDRTVAFIRSFIDW